ncbi:MAG: ATP-binding cassette domain-containing protein [Rhodobacteraceae bacterium]|nr:ATP-binding cassette domain-containing protein [Paracoccaceae bacterium]
MVDPVLSLSGLSRSFGALKATDDVSLKLLPGEIHALIGPNGAGKSTLINLITGELKPNAGEIRFLGNDIGGLDVAARAQAGLARTFQVSSVVADFTVLQNVMLAAQGAGGATFRFFRAALADARLTGPARDHIAAARLADRADIPAAKLSHGERRKLEVAMALALRPRAFLLDEPMAGMGAEGAADLGTLLRPLAATAPILLVEHDMDAVFALSDRISVLVSGRIIATGDVDQIRNDPEVRRVYLGEDA